MKGAFTCPHCSVDNACTCDTYKPYIKDGDFINTWTEDGGAHICGNCGKIYSPDESLDAQWKKYAEPVIQSKQ